MGDIESLLFFYKDGFGIKYLKEYDTYLSNTFAWAGYDTRSIFKRSFTGLNSEFPSPRLVA